MIEQTIERAAELAGFLCPKCNARTLVIDSRYAPRRNGIRRRRKCVCGFRFTTRETQDDTITVTEIMKALARGGVYSVRQLLISKGLHK